ncbi:MAG: hypothetical protein AAF960_10865 [Bacteroidota bacterium]
MKSIIIALVATFITMPNIQAQIPADFSVDADGRLPKVTFVKGKKPKKGTETLIGVAATKAVLLKIAETVYSSELTVGQNIQMKVDRDVKVNGCVVVKTNAYAVGRVKRVSQAHYADSHTTVTIELISVQAVDGQTIELDADEQIFKSPRPGEDLTLHAGKTVMGRFKNDETILLK